ncbi:MAG: TetR/AcrR family transcriptional regulator [Acidobacteria bacterium]|nr:TetR/AcrR family transcriptional regulator [Acidobacteriota bacterium]MBI3487158.1 TetR/AcrR family transcriptional regulator [Acidobacteriota bacterium]
MSEKLSEPNDRRVRRTRMALRAALISLLPKRGWDDLSVHEICERANVGRSTFYMHYQSKEQLLADGLGDLRKVLMVEASERRRTSPKTLPFVRGLMEHVYEQRSLFRSLIGRGSGHVVQMRFRQMVLQLVNEELSLHVDQGWERDAASNYISGALVELLGWWVDSRTLRSVEEVEQFFHNLTSTVIRRL